MEMFNKCAHKIGDGKKIVKVYNLITNYYKAV